MSYVVIGFGGDLVDYYESLVEAEEAVVSHAWQFHTDFISDGSETSFERFQNGVDIKLYELSSSCEIPLKHRDLFDRFTSDSLKYSQESEESDYSTFLKLRSRFEERYQDILKNV